MKSNSEYVAFSALFYIFLCLHIELAQCSFLSSHSSGYSSSDDNSNSLTRPLLGGSNSGRRVSPTSPRTSSPSRSAEANKGKDHSEGRREALERAGFDKESQEIKLKEHQDWIRAHRAKVHENVRRKYFSDDANTSSNSRDRLFRNHHRSAMPPAGHQPNTSGSSSSSPIRNTSNFSYDSQPRTRSSRYRGYIPPTLKDVGLQPTSSTQPNRLPGHLRHSAASSSPSHGTNAKKAK